MIKSQLRYFAKEFSQERRTVLTSIANTNYVEKVVIEDIYVLIDRFGYTKSLDSASFQRLTDDTLKDYPHIVSMKSDDKLCVFTSQGNLHQIKVSAIPRCKAKDKGTLIHNLCKLNNEDLLTYTSFSDLFESRVLFITENGFIKLVSGAEFETNRSTIASTKLDASDQLVCVQFISAHDYTAGNQKVIMLTAKHASLAFGLNEVSEYKKGSRGVKGITIDANDKVIYANCVAPTIEHVLFQGKTIQIKKIRNRKRGAKPQKATGVIED